MIFLGEILTVARLPNKAKVLILATKRPDGLWESSSKGESTLYGVRDLNERQLVIVELDKDDNLIEITGAREQLKKALHAFTVKLARFDSEKAEIALIKESLEYQSIKLYQRACEMDRRDEAQKKQEKKLAQLIDLASVKIAAADRQHAALTEAWEHLHYKEEQLQHYR
jgi:hypothetical protein